MAGLDEEFSAVLDALYDAAGGGRPWREAAHALADFIGGDSVQLMRLDQRGGAPASVSGGPGHVAEAERLYVAHYHRIDPRMPMVQGLAPGRVALCHEHFDEAFVRRDPFYNDFFLPHGFRWVMGGHLPVDAESRLILAVLRRQGAEPFAALQRHKAERLLPHLSRAMAISRHLEAALGEGAVARRLLDHLPWPVLAVDEAGRCVSANRAGDAHLAAGQGLRAVSAGLAGPTPDATARLRQLVTDAIATARRRGGNGGGALACGGEGGDRYRIVVSPLPAAAGVAAGAPGGDALAVVAVHEAARPVVPPGRTLIGLFGLTQAEARLVLALAEGARLSEVAAARGVSQNTLRSQMKSILAKTGCRDQAALLQLVAGLVV